MQKGGRVRKKSDGLELAASRTQFLFKKLAHCKGFDDTFQDGIPTLIAMGTDACEFEIRSPNLLRVGGLPPGRCATETPWMLASWVIVRG